MKIKKITSQYRRDFTAVYQCEHCANEHEATGYDDEHFHRNVIPAMKCPACNQCAPESYRPLATKYASSEIV